MDEADTGIELWVVCQMLFKARHPDQDQANTPTVKNVAGLVKSCHFEPVRLIDNEQGSGIRHVTAHTHGTITLFVKSILGVDCLGAPITVWVRRQSTFRRYPTTPRSKVRYQGALTRV